MNIEGGESADPPNAAYQFFDNYLREHGENGRSRIGPSEEGDQLTLIKDGFFDTITVIFSNEQLQINELWTINQEGPQGVLSESKGESVITGFGMIKGGAVRIGDLDSGQREEFERGFEQIFLSRIRQTFEI